MKKSNITGWKDVFSFTLIQTLKSKAFIISYILFLVLVMISMPLMNLLNPSKTVDANALSPINKVYVSNQTTLPEMDFSKLLEEKQFSNISFVPLAESYDIVADRIEAGEQNSVILTIKESNGLYNMDFVKATKGPIKDNNLTNLGAAVTTQFNTFRIQALGVTQEQLDLLQAPIETFVSKVDVNGVTVVKENTTISMGEYWFIYGILFIVLMVNMLASTQIATSIVTEKSTRVVEYLLTSVKPLALMIGKIFAMLVAVLLQMVSMVVIALISNKVTAMVTPGNGKDYLSKILPKDIFQNLNIVNILTCFILIALGMIFYATLAGLAGATVSKIEEISEGLMLFTMTNLVGVYIGLGAISALMGAGDNAFVTFSYLFPLSSPFVLPGAILIGKASLLIAAGAIVLQLVSIMLLFKFVATVYETLILHNGTRIKLKDLFKISKTA